MGAVVEAPYETDSPRTIPALWARAASAGRDYPAFLVEDGRGWRPVFWEEAAARVEALAFGFLALGVRKGDRVAFLSRTRLEWTLCDFALASLGAVVVPIYLQSSTDDTEHIVSHSGARLALAEGADETRRLLEPAGSLPDLERVVQIEPGAELTLDDVVAAGGELARSDPTAVAKACDALTGDDALTIIYTSGTTGKPKGCVLSHRNFTALVEAVARIEGLFQPGDSAVLFLPLAHNFARLVQYCAAGIGVTIAFCPEPANVGRALLTVRPTLFPSVPRLFEKAYATARGKMDARRAPSRWLAAWALRAGAKAATADGGPGPLLAAQHRIGDRLVLAKVRERLGGRLRLAVSGGAPLSAEIIDFFLACGIPILEGYGLTETTSACTINRPGRLRVGSVGPPLPGIELGSAEDGEIIVRGETVFRGYYRNEEATAAILRPDGWLLTGDVGVFDDDGALRITDRKKEIIVTAGGKKIAPQNVENALVGTGYFTHVLVIGDRRPYISALLALDEDRVGAGAGADPDARRQLVERVVAEVNAGLGRAEQVKRFAVLPRELSIEEGEMTPTLKIKRRVAEEHFRELIEGMYTGR